MLKNSYRFKNKRDLPPEYYSAQPEPKISMMATDYYFNTLVSAQPNAETHSLKIQKGLELLYAQMNGLIQKAKTHGVKAEVFQKQMGLMEKPAFYVFKKPANL